MTVQPVPSSVRPFLGSGVLVVGSLAVFVASAILGATSSGLFPAVVAAVGGLMAVSIAAWHHGAMWGRGVAWTLSVLLVPLGAVAAFVGVWAASYYGSPIADLPGLIGLPIVALVGSLLTLWVVLRPHARPGGDRRS